jgi:tRNA-modifying protein YgfZ
MILFDCLNLSDLPGMRTETKEDTKTAGTWSFAPIGKLAQPVVATLDSLGVIAVEGADAVDFLHGQLTNDVSHLDTQRVQLNGYCSAKGRLYAIFDNWRDAHAVYLQLPREILPGVMKRMSMFVLRAKVGLRDASREWQARAILGPGSATSLKPLLADLPAVGATACLPDGTRLHRLPPSPQIEERLLLLQPTPSSGVIDSKLALAQCPEGLFWWSQIDAGWPNVFAVTQERFVPQMINLEVIGGVNFKKGCYPGQEVVARSQYLGKLRRRMQIAHVASHVAAGEDVFAADSEGPVGTVVMAASAPDGGMDLLFECPAERFEGDLRLVSRAGPRLMLRPLPYALVDVTA